MKLHWHHGVPGTSAAAGARRHMSPNNPNKTMRRAGGTALYLLLLAVTLLLVLSLAPQGTMAAANPSIATVPNPPGTRIDVFDYWITGQNDVDTNWATGYNVNPQTDANRGINQGNPALLFHIYDENDDSRNLAANTWTGRDSWAGAGSFQRLTGFTDYTPRSETPIQGMVASTLGSDGYPRLSGATSVGGSTDSLAYLFNPNVSHAGKRSYTTGQGANNLFWIDPDGYYTYDSTQAWAVYNKDTREFDLQQQGTGAYYGFFPLDGIETQSFNDRVQTGPTRGGRTPSEDGVNHNHYFGLTMTTPFVQPVGGKVTSPSGATQDMTYHFSGDDDVWVYIDGVLIGDLGGIHSVSTLDINFATGVVRVSGRPDTTIREMWEASGAAAPEGGWRDDTFADDTEHELKFYYMERGNDQSNIKLQFNLQTHLVDIEADKFLDDGHDQSAEIREGEYSFDLLDANGDLVSTVPVGTDRHAHWRVPGFSLADFEIPGTGEFRTTATRTYTLREHIPDGATQNADGSWTYYDEARHQNIIYTGKTETVYVTGTLDTTTDEISTAVTYKSGSLSAEYEPSDSDRRQGTISASITGMGPVDGETVTIAGRDGAPMPASTSATVSGTTADFGAVSYPGAGTYVYDVTYGDRTTTLTVEVEEKTQRLSASYQPSSDATNGHIVATLTGYTAEELAETGVSISGSPAPLRAANPTITGTTIDFGDFDPDNKLEPGHTYHYTITAGGQSTGLDVTISEGSTAEPIEISYTRTGSGSWGSGSATYSFSATINGDDLAGKYVFAVWEGNTSNVMGLTEIPAGTGNTFEWSLTGQTRGASDFPSTLQVYLANPEHSWDIYSLDTMDPGRLTRQTVTINSADDASGTSGTGTRATASYENTPASRDVYSAKSSYTESEATAATPTFRNIIPQPVTVSATKEWVVPEGVTTNIVHPAVQFTLHASIMVEGEPQELATIKDAEGTTLTAEQLTQEIPAGATGDDLTVSWDNLPMLDEDGNKISYTIVEEPLEGGTAEKPVPGYTTHVAADPDDPNSIIVTNTLELTRIDGTKVWDDNDGQDAVRPESITVHLLANGHQLNPDITATVTGDDWTFSFNDLPVYDYSSPSSETYGQPITYTVMEDPVTGYQADYGRTGATVAQDGTVTITNTPVPFSLLINKVDPTRSGQGVGERLALPGAGFTVSTQVEDGPATATRYVQSNGSLGETPFEFVSDDYGQVHVTGLKPGTYTITEVTAPVGYELPQNPTMTLVVNSDGSGTFTNLAGGTSDITATDNEYSITIENTGIPNLPIAGGPGSVPLLCIGLAFITFALKRAGLLGQLLALIAKRGG